MKKNFLSLLNLLIIGALGTTIAFAADKKTEYEYLPDSLITDNYVYEYTFSDFGKAEGIMQELRKRKKLPDFRLDMIEGDLYFNTVKKTSYKYRSDNLRYNYNTLLTFQKLDRRNKEALLTLEALQEVVTEQTGTETPIEGLGEKEKKAMYAHYAVVLSRLGQAYEEKGDYRRTAAYFRELAVLRDSIKNREQKSSVLELATIYEINEKDMLIQMQNANARIQNVWLGLAGCIAFFMAVILCFVVRHNRAILVKNRAMAGTIDDLLGYKDELFLRKEENLKLKEENLILNEQWQVVETEWIKWNQAVVVEEEIEIEEETEPRRRMHENTLNDRTLFDKAEYEIISRKLFLQPDFSRDELMKIVHIPKNKFARLFKQYAGVGFSQYINNLRLDHVARMLKEYPDYTVDGIVKESGILTRQTFYRLFSERFGMTPVEYQKAISAL